VKQSLLFSVSDTCISVRLNKWKTIARYVASSLFLSRQCRMVCRQPSERGRRNTSVSIVVCIRGRVLIAWLRVSNGRDFYANNNN